MCRKSDMEGISLDSFILALTVVNRYKRTVCM